MTKTETNPKNHFMNLTPGKLMGLRQITDETGRFKVLAMDQSNSFKKALRALHERQGKPAEPDYAEIRDCKMQMASALAPYASALLLDVNYGARQALNSLSLPRGIGLIVRVEASKDAGLPAEYEPGWSVEKIKRMGGSAVKLLVYLDTEDKNNAKTQLSFVEKVWKACREADILLMTEELSFPRKGEDKNSPAYQARKVKNILDATRLLGPYTDILKLEFPGNIKTDPEPKLQENLARLNEIALRPWVLLSAGEKFDLFSKQVELAMKAHASGYMAGRAIFNEYFDQKSAQERARFLATTAVERMQQLNALVDRSAQSWLKRYGIEPQELAASVTPEWYLDKSSLKTPRPVEVQGAY